MKYVDINFENEKTSLSRMIFGTHNFGKDCYYENAKRKL